MLSIWAHFAFQPCVEGVAIFTGAASLSSVALCAGFIPSLALLLTEIHRIVVIRILEALQQARLIPCWACLGWNTFDHLAVWRIPVLPVPTLGEKL
jgi:hypothetical protein